MVKAGTVLLVDDEDIMLRVQAAAVRQFGFHAVIAETAQEALEKAEHVQPELIISDVQMPGEGGFDFVSVLQGRGLKTMPVIYLTAYDDVRLVSGGLKAGGDDFIIKGASIEQLRQRIAFWMASGFAGLPADIRRRSQSLAEAAAANAFLGVESALVIQRDRCQEIASQLEEERKALPPGYGYRLVERLCILGRASKLLIDRSQTAGDMIRFPDHLRLILKGVDAPWAEDFAPLFSTFDLWCQDIRFVRAGPVPLMPFQDYPIES